MDIRFSDFVKLICVGLIIAVIFFVDNFIKQRKNKTTLNTPTGQLLSSEYFPCVFADYHQFFIVDAKYCEETPTLFSDLDCERRVFVGDFCVVLQPERNMDVPVRVLIYDREPSFKSKDWDHIAEAYVDLPTGILRLNTIHECYGEMNVSPGRYRIRFLGGGFSTIAKIGVDGNDYYQCELWPAQSTDVNVIKQFTP